MILYGLRLLVALLTFTVGLAAAWLFNSETPKRTECRVATSRAILSEVAPAQVEAPRNCWTRELRKPKIVTSGGLLNGKAISKPTPLYPPAAKEAHVSGTVSVQIEVDEDGNVVTAEAKDGPEMLREAAEQAALKARFSPTRLSGQPVKVAGVITYNFVLN